MTSHVSLLNEWAEQTTVFRKSRLLLELQTRWLAFDHREGCIHFTYPLVTTHSGLEITGSAIAFIASIRTVDYLRDTDNEQMRVFYKKDKLL